MIKTLEAVFKVRRNVIYERARFNRRDQKDGESAERYTALYGLAETCNYGVLKEEMLGDRLVVGIKVSNRYRKSTRWMQNFIRTSEKSHSSEGSSPRATRRRLDGIKEQEDSISPTGSDFA